MAEATPKIIIDSDLGMWWDDASAIGIAHVLHEQGHIEILGITSCLSDASCAAGIAALNHAYGHESIPIGQPENGPSAGGPMVVSDALREAYAHALPTIHDAPELLLQLLVDQPDASVTIVALGGLTNMASIMLSARELVKNKVKRIFIMDGFFPDDTPPLTNQLLDPGATATVVHEPGWPTPITWVDGYCGIATLVGATLLTSVAGSHPMRIAYEAFFGRSNPTEGSWDAPTLLCATGLFDHHFLEHGHGGAARLGTHGGLAWHANDLTRHDDCYVRIGDQQALNTAIDALLINR